MPFKFTTLPTSHFSREAAAKAARFAIDASDLAEVVVEEAFETAALLGAARTGTQAAQHACDMVMRSMEAITLAHTVKNLINSKAAHASKIAAACAADAAHDTTQSAASASAYLSEAITFARSKRNGPRGTQLLQASLSSNIAMSDRFQRDDGLASVKTKLACFQTFSTMLVDTVDDLKGELNVIDHRIIDAKQVAENAAERIGQIQRKQSFTLQRVKESQERFDEKVGAAPYMSMLMEKASIDPKVNVNKEPKFFKRRTSFAQKLMSTGRPQDGLKLPSLNRRNGTKGVQKGTVLYKARF